MSGCRMIHVGSRKGGYTAIVCGDTSRCDHDWSGELYRTRKGKEITKLKPYTDIAWMTRDMWRITVNDRLEEEDDYIVEATTVCSKCGEVFNPLKHIEL